jgi:hypothetical protein
MPRNVTNQVASVMYVERRGAPRFSSNLEIVIVRDGQVQRATAVDVSMTGMRLIAEVEISTGTQLDAHFSLEGKMTMNELQGVVVWSAPSPDIAGVFCAGLAFQRMPARSREALASLIRELSGAAASSVEETSMVPPPLPRRVPARATSYTPPLALDARRPSAHQPAANQPQPQPLGQDQIEENRERAQLLIAEAHKAQSAGDPASAVELARAAVELVPGSAEIVEELAAATYLAGDVVESAKLFAQALSLRLAQGD